jgi:NADP-dependent 3-hydroxy acid dehydrogenase YdfG
MKVNNKIVAVTGAGSGIGRALVEELLLMGASVAASDVDKQGLEYLRGKAPEARLLLSIVDVADQQAVTAWQMEAEHYFGGVDIIINNAGVALSSHAARQAREQMEWLFSINYWGVINGTEAFLPSLMARPEAYVVNISSLFGLLSVPSQSAYNAAKFAVRGYSESLRQDLRDSHVKVLTVHPGGIQTNIANNGRHFDAMTSSSGDVERTAELFNAIAKTSPQQAAKAILRSISKNKRRLLIGSDAKLLDLIQRLFPGSYDRILLPLVNFGSRRILKKLDAKRRNAVKAS